MSSITFENLPRDYEQLPVPTYILKGRSSAHQGGLIEAVCDQFPTQYYEVYEGYFKCYLHLGPGANNITIRHIDGTINNSGYLTPQQNTTVHAEAKVIMTYNPLVKTAKFETPVVNLCVLLGKDSKGIFDCPQDNLWQGNDLDVAVRKLRVAGRIMQAFTIDEMARNGVGKRCWQFREEVAKSTISAQEEQQGVSRSQIKVHVLRSDKTVAELQSMDVAQQNPHAKDQGGLFGIAMRAVKAYGGPFSDQATKDTPAMAAVMLLDSHWSKKDNCILGHAALGGGDDRVKLAIFGSHGLHSWPTSWESIFRGYTDCSTLSTNEVANDCNECSSRWECLCVTLGAFMHEIGHELGCPHEENGVMLRDYVTMDRKFLSKERYCIRTKRNEWGPVLTEHEPGWNRLDIDRFLFHPAFTLAEDFNDPTFKPDCIYFNQGMRVSNQVDAGPNFVPIDNNTLEVESDTGIYLVECKVGEWSRVHYEYLPISCNGMGPQKSIRLQVNVIQQQLAPQWRNKPVQIEVHTMGGDRGCEIAKFLQERSGGIRTPEGFVIKKADLYGTNKGKPVQIIFPAGHGITEIRASSGMALDGFQVFFDNGSSVTYGNMKNSYASFKLQQGEQLIGCAIHSGAWVDGVAFITNMRTSPNYGGNGGSMHRFVAPQGMCLAGFYGSMGSWVNQLGAFYA